MIGKRTSRGFGFGWGGALLVAALASACARAPLGEDGVGSVTSESSALTAAALPRTGWVATASSSASGLTPDKAIDGNAGTRWTSGVPQANGQWFQVDMLTPQTFVQLSLDATGSSADYPRKYSVFVSNDGTNWGTAVATGTGTTALTTITFPQQTARYLRVTQTGSTTSWWSIYELNVYPTAFALPRAGWIASASLTCQNDVPANVLDGNASTRWSNGVNQASGQWFQVDMRTPQVFDGLSIDATTSSGDYARGFQVFVSNDGTSWGTAVATGTGTAPLVAISFPQQSARYFRIVLNKSSSTNWWSIGELNVYRARVAGTVQAIAECVLPQAGGTYKAVFGYNSSAPSGTTLSIPVGANNMFDTGTAGRGQPTSFAPGRHTAQFIVPFDGKALTWAVDGSSSTASAMLPTCVASCTQHLTDTTKPRIDGVLPTAAAPLSIEDSAAQRDAFRWNDVLPVPEKFSDGSPRFYYGLFFVDGPGTALAMDALRIHYDNIPLFDTEFNSLQALGLQTLSYPNDGQGQFVYGLVPGAVYNALQQAAMDPTNPTEIFRSAPLRPMPANDLGLGTVSSCGLVPVAQCVAKAANGSLRAVFSYSNPSGAGVTIPLGPDNVLSGASGAVTVPEAFAAGSHTAVFAAPFATGSTVTWQLGGTTVSLNASSPLCSTAVVNQIGVDTFNPFPPAPAPSCRPATPNEVQFPQSKLPPAARLNTCVSMAYNFASSVGFLWRGVDNAAADAAGQAADAALALADSVPDMVAAPAGSASANVQVVQSALFGKLFRKVVQKVAAVAKTVVDDGRRVLRAGVGLFVGSTDVTVTTVPINSDPLVGGPNSPMTTAWVNGIPGAGYNQPISLQGMQIRANKGPFLSVGNLDGGNKAGIKVLNHLGAHICYTASTAAAKVVDGWMTPVTICPSDSSANIGGSPPATRTVNAEHLVMNLMAQMNDAHTYMSRAQGYSTEQAEAIVGIVPNVIGLLNQNRAFTPCFAFSWQNDVVKFLAVLGGVATTRLNDYLVPKIESGAATLARETVKTATKLEAQAAQLATVAAQAAGTALAGPANTALNAARGAATAARAAANQAQVLAQDAGDVVQAVGTAARKVTGNDPNVVAAQNAAKATLDEIKAKAPAVKNAALAAKNAATDAATATANLLIAAGGAAASPVIDAIDKEVHVAQEAGARALDILGQITLDVEKVAAKAIGEIVGAALGATLGQVFEVLAGGDILYPAAGGDTINLRSRGVATHEYGHFTLCSLLDRISPSSFADVYDEAASQGLVTMQSPSATSAVLNESFADLITSQVAGGTNYAVPAGSKPGTLMNYCLAAGTDCIETNTTNDQVAGKFENAVLRNVSMYTDALDNPFVPTIDGSQNGRAWDILSGVIVKVSASSSAGMADEEAVSLGRNAFVPWIAHSLSRNRFLLTEDSMFGGLADVMFDQKFNWCQVCEVFQLHTVDLAVMSKPAICPTAWVGPRPNVNFTGTPAPMACIFENGNTCPAGLVANHTSRVCEPICPTGSHFDSVKMSCVGDVIIP